jgi:hypothetical protein
VYDTERPLRPERPERPEPVPRKSSLLPVVMVLVPIAVFVTGIVAFTGQAGLLMLAAIACIPAFMALHYLLWGHWLSKNIRQEAADAEQAGRENE